MAGESLLAASGWRRRRPPTGLAGVVFWLAVAFALLSVLRLLPGSLGTLCAVLQAISGILLILLAIPVAWRLVRQRMLWSLRSKLVLTYLLIGMAPVILGVTLAMISAYIAAGQFAIHLVDSRVQSELEHLGSDSANLSGYVTDSQNHPDPTRPPETISERWSHVLRGVHSSRSHTALQVFSEATSVGTTPRSEGATPLGLPPWAMRLPRDRFRHLVLDGDELFLVAIDQRREADGHRISLVTSLPIDEALMQVIADGLGRAGILPSLTGGESPESRSLASNPKAAAAKRRVVTRDTLRRSSVFGGNEPGPASLLDLRVRFLSTLPVVNWDTGETENVPIEVYSRPSLLYYQLFGGSLSGIVTSVIRVGLIILCILFALIEMLALYMAARLSRTVTASVTDLYHATQRIDQGDFAYRIGVHREDQLAELSRSFNRMTGSLQRLLKEQKEKERLQNEISIAQEVQANLFPQKSSNLPRLELHGVCKPARSVSGDYYDFLVFYEQARGAHEQAQDGKPGRKEIGVGIAIGDISGKGISAALLMATLHSAVRAYRFASEELVFSDSSIAGLTEARDGSGGCDELFQSPGRILSLLNRHLYRSTQPEKYATLFLAHYDAPTCRLTYSNAGQLPPLVLSTDGSIRRLDCGGTVVGLMDGMTYEEDNFVMRPGDILVAYSDGVTEPENDFGEFGEERLMEVVRHYRDEPLHVISREVMGALSAWIGAEEQPDDITLVLARQT